ARSRTRRLERGNDPARVGSSEPAWSSRTFHSWQTSLLSCQSQPSSFSRIALPRRKDSRHNSHAAFRTRSFSRFCFGGVYLWLSGTRRREIRKRHRSHGRGQSQSRRCSWKTEQYRSIASASSKPHRLFPLRVQDKVRERKSFP